MAAGGGKSSGHVATYKELEENDHHACMTPADRTGYMTHMYINRPPKGDRSEGFYINISIFIDFSWFGANFIKNHILIYGN